ncbi:MAG: methylated-DNA--[protein]-cysteine S-methyltransferase [Paracoccaceae bacterium]
MPETTVETLLGPVRIQADDIHITAINWGIGSYDDTPVLREAAKQLAAYFAKDITEFDLPLKPKGDSFQQSVCKAMCAIPYGETRTYGELAKDLGSMPQPVGNACGLNSIPIIIPCHRVVGRDGLGGFSAPGGVETKVALLRHEEAYALLL